MTVSQALASVPLANMASIVTALRLTRDPNVDRSDALQNARMLRDDRNWAAANLSESEKTRVRGLMWRRALREAAVAAHRRLRGSSDDYRRAGHGAEVQDTFVDFVDAHPAAVPMRRVGDAMLYAFAEVAQRRAEGSKKERELASSLYDQAHALLGAAYCDVFTCDALVDRCLGDVRIGLGLPKQLSVACAGGEAAFISELMTRVAI
ncbi:MAG: hypothetical protein HYV09_21400 [Deltaproteobacteria bacterium]|nr:hypothetical protein [Deltaproteobacteria bacterium]